MAKWDMTTAEGREALERFLVKRIGYIYEDPKKPWEGWFIVQTLDGYREYLPDHVEPGWVFTPEGMVALKRWAAEKHGLCISSEPPVSRFNAPAEALVYDIVTGKEFVYEHTDDEPTSVALALARALEEMER